MVDLLDVVFGKNREILYGKGNSLLKISAHDGLNIFWHASFAKEPRELLFDTRRITR